MNGSSSALNYTNVNTLQLDEPNPETLFISSDSQAQATMLSVVCHTSVLNAMYH